MRSQQMRVPDLPLEVSQRLRKLCGIGMAMYSQENTGWIEHKVNNRRSSLKCTSLVVCFIFDRVHFLFPSIHSFLIFWNTEFQHLLKGTSHLSL